MPASEHADVELLRRQLERERRALATAERIGESATAELWQTVQRLEEADRQLRAKAEQARLSHEMTRMLRLDLDPQQTMRRALAALGASLGVDRCLIRLADDDQGIGTVMEQWVRPGGSALAASTELTANLGSLANTHAETGQALWVSDVDTDPRLGDIGPVGVRQHLGCAAYAGVPMWVGPRLVGWLALHRTEGPHEWTERERAVTEGLAYDLGGAILQALAHQQQIETVERLREVDRVKTEFVSRVSHELRTPLTSIRGYVEMLIDQSFGAVSESQLLALGITVRNCDRLLTLIENLLVLSEADSGPSVKGYVALDLAEIVSDVQAALVPVLSGRDLEVSFPTVPPVKRLSGDVQELERVLLNLLTNAVKFTPDGGRVTLQVTTSADEVRIVVADTGIGISPADLPHVFRRFFRSQSAIRAEVPGTGLGLSLVKSIVEAHGGSIAVSSHPGVGSTFVVTLPTDGSRDGRRDASPRFTVTASRIPA
jgi:signal transduction histidine kinase